MSTTTIQTIATTILDPRDVDTICAALLCYQAQRVHPASLGDDVHDAATGDGAHLPLNHLETYELLDLIKAGDAVEINTLGADWEETSNDTQQALEHHAAARADQQGATVSVLAVPGMSPVC